MRKNAANGEWHIDPDVLRALERGDVAPQEYLSLLMGHLAHLCIDCQDAIRHFVAHRSEHEEWETAARGAGFLCGAGSLDCAVDQALAQAGSYFALELRAGREASELLALPTREERLQAVRQPFGRFRNPALIEALLERSRRLVGSRPRVAEEVASLALELAFRLPHEAFGARFRLDRMAEAMAHQADALRALGELSRAEDLLTEARGFADGTIDPLLLSDLEAFSAAVARERRSWSAACDFLERAERHLQGVGVDPAIEARLRLRRAAVLYYDGDLEQATDLARQTLDSIDRDRDPGLELCARHNLAWYLCELERYREAAELVPEDEPALDGVEDESVVLRCRWLQGRIARGLGDEETAESALTGVRDSFLRSGQGYDAALAALDLAELYLTAGRPADVRETADWTSTLFSVADLHGDAFTILGLFRQAAQEDLLTVSEIRAVARFLNGVRVHAGVEAEAAS